MQDEISLRDLIETVWNGKIIIAGVTAIAVLLATVFTLFIISPTYEVRAQVRLDMKDPESSSILINSLANSATSDVSLNRVIQKLELDPQEYSILMLRNSITIATLPGTNIINLSMTGANTDHITKIINLVAFELGARSEIMDRSENIVGNKAKLEDIENELPLIRKEIEVTNQRLTMIPEKLVTKKTLSDDPYLLSVVEQRSGTGVQELGEFELVQEEINPLHTELTANVAQAEIALSKMEEEVTTLQTAIEQDEARINELEIQINNEGLKGTNSEKLLNGNNAVFISPAIEPTAPTGPSLIKNIVFGAIVGIVLSVLFVFIRDYWRKTELPSNLKP